MLCKEATHTAPYLVSLGGGVEGSSVEWGPLLALVPLLERDTHHSGGEGKEGEKRGREGRGGERMGGGGAGERIQLNE